MGEGEKEGRHGGEVGNADAGGELLLSCCWDGLPTCSGCSWTRRFYPPLVDANGGESGSCRGRVPRRHSPLHRWARRGQGHRAAVREAGSGTAGQPVVGQGGPPLLATLPGRSAAPPQSVGQAERQSRVPSPRHVPSGAYLPGGLFGLTAQCAGTILAGAVEARFPLEEVGGADCWRVGVRDVGSLAAIARTLTAVDHQRGSRMSVPCHSLACHTAGHPARAAQSNSVVRRAMGEAPLPQPFRARRMLARRTAHSSASRRCKVHAFSDKAVARHPPGGSRRCPFPQRPGHYAAASRVPRADEPHPTARGHRRVRGRPKQIPWRGGPRRAVANGVSAPAVRAMRHAAPRSLGVCPARGRRRARRIPARSPRLHPRLPTPFTPWVRRGLPSMTRATAALWHRGQ